MSAPTFTHVRYAVVAVATLMAVLLYLDRICLSITLQAIQDDLPLSDFQASCLLSAFFWSYALAQVPSGWLSDRYGARKMLSLYIALWSIFTGLMGLTWSFALLLVYRFGCGVAQAGAYPTSAGLLSKWAPLPRRALTSAIVANGGRLGGVIAPLLTAYLMVFFDPTTESGWRPVLVTYGLAGLGVAWLFWWVVRDRPREHPSCKAAEIALIEAGRTSKDAASGPAATLPLLAMIRSRSLWLSALSQFGTNFGWLFLITWMPRYLDKVYHVELVERGWMCSQPLLWGMAGMMFGGVLTDWLTRMLGLRWGRSLPMGLTRFLAAAAFVSCIRLGTPWQATAALCVVAFATDLGIPAVWAFKQDIGGTYVGSVLGWGNMWGNMGAAVSPLVLNWVIAAYGWDAMFWTCGGAFLLSGVAALGVDARVPVSRESDQ